MNSFVRWIYTLLISVAVGLPAAHAAPSAEVTKGLVWLQAQVQPDGTLANESTSIATGLQARVEAAETLNLLATTPSSLTTAISSELEDNTEYLSRRILAQAQAGLNVSALLPTLTSRQNTDGGFGGAIGQESNTLDTAWTLLALANSGQNFSSAALLARDFLSASLASDGGAPGETDAYRLHNSAMALLALQVVSPDINASTAINKLTLWILQHQGVDGSWGQDSYLSGIALLAISPIVTDTNVRTAARSYLAAQQASDGSWGADPFITAVILRALSSEPAVASPLKGTFIGTVIDQAGGTPIAGATITVTGPTPSSVQSGQDGKFVLGNLSGGAYNVQIQKTGYSAFSKPYSVANGQTVDLGSVAMVQLASAGIVRGKITAASSGSPLTGVAIALTGSATLNTLTDSSGNFEFTGVTPGTVILSATMAGYTAATGSAPLVAGQTLVFSPALFATGSPAPTTGQFIGKVVTAGTNAPLQGVGIQLNGASAGSTAADGTFNLTLNPASYAAIMSLVGYDAVSANFVMTAGTIINAGTIALNKQLTSSSISGRIVDQANGAPIPGAQIQVVGGVTATAGLDGAYSLSSLLGTSFDLRVTATGYLSQSRQLQLTRPSDVTQDFALAAQGSSSLELSALTVAPASVASRTDIAVTATVSNKGTASASGVLTMQVQDSQGKVLSLGAAYDATGNSLLGTFTLDPGQSIPIVLKWNSGQFPPDTYTFIVRASEAGTLTASNPLGVVLSTRQGVVAVLGGQHFTGAITADPPVLRAQTNTAVHLSALLQNDGNVGIPAQSYQLLVINDATNVVVGMQAVPGIDFLPNALQSLQFADWTPTVGGNYRVEIQAAQGASLGKITQMVYVGDAATATFTVSKSVVPAGTQTVKGNIHISGQDSVTGAISDPLAPLIKAAIQRGVTFNDTAASNRTLSDHCLACHVQTQALVSGETTRRLTSFNAQQRNILVNGLALNQQSDGYFDTNFPYHSKTETMLGMWALNAFHNKSEFIPTMLKAASYLLRNQEADGHWINDHRTGEAWWQPDATQTAMNIKNLADFSKQLAQMPASSIGIWTSQQWFSGPAINSPQSIAVAGSGNIYVSNADGTVWVVRADGSTHTLLSGLTNPRGLVITADETLFVGTSSGVIKRTPDGTVSTALSPGAFGVVIGPDQNFYLSDPANNKIIQVTPQGVATDYIVGGALRAPEGIAFSPEGDLIVVNSGDAKVLRFHPDKTYDIVVYWSNGNPHNVAYTGQGWLLTTDTGVYLFNSQWQGQRLTYAGARGAAVMADGSLLTDNGSNTLLKLSFAQTDIPALTGSINGALNRATSWLLQDGTTDATSNMDVAFRLIGLGSAWQYFQGTPLGDAALAKTQSLATLLRSRQQADGGWGRTISNSSDSMVTAQVGYALDYLSPSSQDPAIRSAIQYVLSRQQADGSWLSENGVFRTQIGSTTWVVIWLPIALDRLGGIDTDLTVAMPGNVSLANPSIAPTSTSPNASGGTNYIWKLQGVTSIGQNINFDLTLTNLALNESRPVASDAHLTFNNTFTHTPVTAPISVPSVTASAFMMLDAATDKPLYGSNMALLGSGIVQNLTTVANAGFLNLQIYSADGTLVSDLGTQPFAGLGASQQRKLDAIWNSGTYAAGGYYLLATLYDSQNVRAATARAFFSIYGVVGSSPVSAKITTDKQTYQPYDFVKVSDRISNLTQNQAIDGLTAITLLTKPDGTVLWTKIVPLGQLVASTYQDLNYGVSLSNAIAGSYKASLSVLNSAGAQAAYAETFFTVSSSAQTGSGLTGTISADPKKVPLGDAVILSSSALNAGNADLTGAVVKVTIVDPVAQTVVTEWPTTVNLVQQQPYAISRTWTTQGSVGQTYVAVLTADIGGKVITLAQDTFTLIEPPIKLDIAQAIQRQNRVLALISCEPGEPSDSGDPKSDSSSKSSSEDGDHAKQICAAQRAQFLDAYLNAIPVEHLVITTENDFRKAFRSGRYNVYWIAGGKEKLEDDLAEEVREAVYRGDSLILDGVHDERNHSLDDAAGIVYRGKLSATGQPITLTEATLGAVGLDLNTRGQALRLEPSTGLAQATFATILHADEDHDSDHKTNAIYPAIISNVYGSGQALTFAFDWLDTLRNDRLNAWANPAQAALVYLLPPVPTTLSARGYVPVETIIRNLTKSIDIAVTMQLPTGGQAINTIPLASLNAAGLPTWQFPLPETGEQRLLLGLRLPSLGGTQTLDTAVISIRHAQRKLYGNYSLSFTVAAAEQIGTEVLSNLQSLIFPTTQERQARDKAVGYIQQALTSLGRNDPAEAIDKLLETVGELRKIQSQGIGAYRLDIDRMLQDAAARWYATNL